MKKRLFWGLLALTLLLTLSPAQAAEDDSGEISALITLNGAVVSGPLTGEEAPGAWCWRNYEDGGGAQAWSYLHWVVPRDRAEWAATMAWVPALLDFDGVEIPGNLAYADDLPNFRGPVLRFYPDVTDDRVAQRVADWLRFPEGTGFADVGCHDWFAPYVQVCVAHGLMEGTGEDRFEPDRPLTDPECLTLALRLYDMQNGGSGALKKAPESLGKMVLTLVDGTEITGYQGDNDPFWCWSYHGALSKHIQPPGATLEEREAWCRAHEGPAALAAAGQVWQGQTVLYYTPAGRGREVVLDFTPIPEDREAMSQVIGEGLLYEGVPGPDKWWRDAAYTRETLEDEAVRGSMSDLTGDSKALTTRWEFTGALAGAAGELEKRNSIPDLPDLDRDRHNEGRYGLYEAGVLSGVDQYGSLAGGRTLTRAEAAAMAARVLEPSLRLTFTPADYSSFLASGLTPETVMFQDGTTAEEFLNAVHIAICRAEERAAMHTRPFHWHTVETDDGQTRTTLERVRADVLEELRVTEEQGSQTYREFDYQLYYARLIQLTGEDLSPKYAVGTGAS